MTAVLEAPSTVLEKPTLMVGKVCHYDKAGKFGFIEIPGHERTVFFHNSRQRSYYCGLDAQIYDDGFAMAEPAVGDEVIIYALQVVEKGPRATYWARTDTKTHAEELQSLMHTYRLRRRIGREKVSSLDPWPEYQTLYEGRNLLELTEKSKGLRIERDEFDYYYFEILNSDIWDYCEDPRP